MPFVLLACQYGISIIQLHQESSSRTKLLLIKEMLIRFCKIKLNSLQCCNAALEMKLEPNRRYTTNYIGRATEGGSQNISKSAYDNDNN